MNPSTFVGRVPVVALLLLVTSAPLYPRTPVAMAGQATAEATASAKTWVDRRQELEDYLRTAVVTKLEEIGLGVTKPRRAWLAPGGPFDRMAWKTIAPGIHSGYWESYKSEIAAYELDKLHGLDMIPPTVERQVHRESGAAVMWASPTKSFKDLGGPPTPPAAHAAKWNRQLIQAKMFDNLIANIDPNLGNWLVDPSWNLILIDHTRSFTPKKDMVHVMTRIDHELWQRMKALTVESLTPALKKWMANRDIRAIIERRDRMQSVIDKLVATKGEAAVFVR
jgi:hypothetical protein